MNDRGQALVEYALITAVLVAGFYFGHLLVKNAFGPLYPKFVESLGLYSIYSNSYEVVLSLPFP